MTSKQNGFMADLSSEAQRARAKKNRGRTPWRCGPACATKKAHETSAAFAAANSQRVKNDR